MDDLRHAYDPERFRREGHQLVDDLADYLAQALDRRMPVLPWVAPQDARAEWPADFPDEPRGDLSSLLRRVLASSHHLHHPRYVGHQVSAPLPMAALCELCAQLLNNGMAVYEMGPVSTAMERNLVRWLAECLGMSAGDGVLTSGGSVGNLTALLAARRLKAGFDVWGQGAQAGPPLAVLVSEQGHYSIKRAAQIMGIGEAGCQPVPVDAHFRMRADALPGALAAAERDGRRAIAVVASAGSTATGAFDPLGPIADFCQAHDLWLHVDGAHGASAALSPIHRGLLAGIERADSVVWDMHKMMMMPALVTAVLFKDAAASHAPFAQQAAYLFTGDEASERESFDVGQRTLECTKKMLALRVYAALELFGTRLFATYLEHTFALAQRFAARLAADSAFELAVVPQANIVCFRHLVAGREPDELNAGIRRRIVESGKFYLVQTRLPRGLFLRVTLIHPLTTDEDLAALLDEIRANI